MFLPRLNILYGDDTKIYRELRSPTSDVQILQTDLVILGHWGNTWQLHFHEKKCEAMHLMHSREKSTTDYTLSTTLKDVKSFKDLGVIISKNLFWSKHISTIVNKVIRSWGLLNGLLEQLIQEPFHCSTNHWSDLY